MERPNTNPNLIARQTLEAEWNVAYARRDIDTRSRKSRFSSPSFLSHLISPRRPIGIMSSVIDTARENRYVYPGFSLTRWNSLTQTSRLWNFADFTRRFRLLRGKLTHKVHKIFISRFLVLPKISNSCSPSLLNKYQITFREWMSQGDGIAWNIATRNLSAYSPVPDACWYFVTYLRSYPLDYHTRTAICHGHTYFASFPAGTSLWMTTFFRFLSMSMQYK